MDELRRLSQDELKDVIYKILLDKSEPLTISEIVKQADLIEDLPYIYKHEITRCVWIMVANGLVTVRSGKISLI